MNRPKVLIIDDEENLRQLLARILELEGYEILQAPTAKTALKLLEKNSVHVVIADVKLPDGNGIELTGTIKSKFPNLEVIVLTAFGTISDGVQAIKNGAFDYLTKGDHKDKIIPLVAKASEKAMLRFRIQALESKLSDKYGFERVIGQSAAIQQSIALAKKVASTDTTVLLTGETGTGKEVFARAIHYSGPRSHEAFVAVNCSALGQDILESELFGHRAGAFTGALKDQLGLFQEADRGSIFLDEIGEMNAGLQVKLLRVLESGSFIRVGDTKETKVDVRIIAATNRDLTEEIKHGRFREDLYYRLSVFQISLPPLRDRTEDIRALAEFFVRHFAAKVNRRLPAIDEPFLQALEQHEWRGNIRELKNIIERAVIMSDGENVTTASLPYAFNAEALAGSWDLQSIEKTHIQKTLAHTGGNKTQAAKLLGIGLTTLYQKIKDYHLA